VSGVPTAEWSVSGVRHKSAVTVSDDRAAGSRPTFMVIPNLCATVYALHLPLSDSERMVCVP
jgi:hypothetical protein